MLETIRKYADDRLAETGPEVVGCTRGRHFEYFLKISQEVAPQISGITTVEQGKLVKRLLLDIDNLRSALEWASKSDRIDDALHLMDALGEFLLIFVGQAEVLPRLQSLLAQPVKEENTRVRAEAYLQLYEIRIRAGELEHAMSALDKAHAITLALGDVDLQSAVVYRIAYVVGIQGDYALAHSYVDQWRALAIAGGIIGENQLQETESRLQGQLAFSEGDYPRAQYWLTKNLATIIGTGGSGNRIATWARARMLGYTLLYQEDFSQASARLRESLVDNTALGDMQAVAACLAAFAALAIARLDLQRAARLFGASEAISESVHMPLQHWDYGAGPPQCGSSARATGCGDLNATFGDIISPAIALLHH
jgi:tetratricopeptide (TPR) repeat protein